MGCGCTAMMNFLPGYRELRLSILPEAEASMPTLNFRSFEGWWMSRIVGHYVRDVARGTSAPVPVGALVPIRYRLAVDSSVGRKAPHLGLHSVRHAFTSPHVMSVRVAGGLERKRGTPWQGVEATGQGGDAGDGGGGHARESYGLTCTANFQPMHMRLPYPNGA